MLRKTTFIKNTLQVIVIMQSDSDLTLENCRAFTHFLAILTFLCVSFNNEISFMFCDLVFDLYCFSLSSDLALSCVL